MDKVLGLLGLAHKGGHLAIGEEPVAALAQPGRARVILLAADAAENTRRRAGHFAALHGTPLLDLPYDKLTLGAAIGRGGCAMLALSDVRMALSLVQAMGLSDDDPVVRELMARSERVVQRRAAEQAQRRRAKKT